MTPSPLAACRAALAENLRNCHGKLDERFYVATAIENLVTGVRLEDFESDLRQGDGNEMEGKFRAAHSSSALGVNNFAPYKRNIEKLTLPSDQSFNSLQFEKKCPHGLVGRKPPNLDVLAEGADGVVAIESKCLEYLSPHTASFAPAYDREIQDARRQSPWFAEMQRLVSDQSRYRWLDAAQLVKHAFGLIHTFQDRKLTLLYLFWEPSNPDHHSVFSDHRAEIARFASAVDSDRLSFRAMSYPELWRFWEAKGDSSIKDHVARLRGRYAATI